MRKVGHRRGVEGMSLRLGTPMPDRVVVLLHCYCYYCYCWREEVSRRYRIGCISAVRPHFHFHYLLPLLLLWKKKGRGNKRRP